MPLKLRSTLSFVNRFIDLTLKFSNFIVESCDLKIRLLCLCSIYYWRD